MESNAPNENNLHTSVLNQLCIHGYKYIYTVQLRAFSCIYNVIEHHILIRVCEGEEKLFTKDDI